MIKKALLTLLTLPVLGFSQCWSSCYEAPPIPYCSGAETGITISGDFLYWKAYEDGLRFASISGLDANGELFSRFFEVNFRTDPGFRLSAGYRLPCYHWDLSLSWTRFNTTAKRSLVAETPDVLNPLFVRSGVTIFAQEGDANWKLDHDALDIQWGRIFPISLETYLQPYFGAKIAWLNQRFRVEYRDFNNNLPDQNYIGRNDFSGAGPKIGLAGIWEVWKYISFYSNLSTSLLWGEFKNRITITNVDIGGGPGPFTPGNFTINMSRLRPVVQGQVGLTIQIPFRCERHWFFLTTAYEAQYWWAQNEFITFEDVDSPDKDLSFQGLTVRAGFNF